MRIIIVIIIFSFSGIFAQDERNEIIQFKMGMKTNNTNSYIKFETAQQDNSSLQHHSFINLSGQTLVGSALAIGFSILPLSAGVANAWSGESTEASQTALGILAISSYLFGAAVGVHWIASIENHNLSFWGTAGYSVLGGSVGAIIVSILATNYTTIPNVGVIIVALTPIIGSMAYASFIAEWPMESQEISFHKKYFSHKDLIEQSKIINIEFLKIKL